LVVLHSQPDTSLSASRTWDKQKQEEKKQLQAGLFSLVTGQQNKPSASRSMPLAQALKELQKTTGGPFRYPAEFDDAAPLEQQLESIANRSGIQVRKIRLSSNWQERDYQDLLIVTRQSQTPLAAIKHSDASSDQGYRIKLPSELSQDMADLLDYSNRRLERADAKLPELAPSAYCFTQPLDGKSQNNFLSFFKQFISRHRTELSRIGLLSLLGVGMALFVPLVSRTLMNEIIPDGSKDRLLYIAAMFVGITCITTVLNLLRSVYLLTLQTLLSWRTQEAIMNRMLLPIQFIKRYSSGDLLPGIARSGLDRPDNCCSFRNSWLHSGLFQLRSFKQRTFASLYETEGLFRRMAKQQLLQR